MKIPVSPGDTRVVATEAHLCDNYLHLLFATADLAEKARRKHAPHASIFFIADHYRPGADLVTEIQRLTNAEVHLVSDLAAIESFATLPRLLPGVLRRNVSVVEGPKIVYPYQWQPSFFPPQPYDIGYAYHPGFFLSKTLAGWSRCLVMRDSGYANYVVHRVPWRRAVFRLIARRPPRRQIWGEEPWVDRIEVTRPDDLPDSVRHKATRRTLAEVMGALPEPTSRSIALAFWGDKIPVPSFDGRSALLLTQPIDQLGFCTSNEKAALYDHISTRLEHLGYTVMTKAHPREANSSGSIPAEFPIEAWPWIGGRQFDLAVALNSTSLSDRGQDLATEQLQLISPDAFYAGFWSKWPQMVDSSFSRWRPGF